MSNTARSLEFTFVKIDSVDLFYFSMPEVLDIGDGSQDLLLVRLESGGEVGYGECEASPLVSIASFVTPMSHSACKPVRDSVLGQRLDSVADIRRIGNLVRANSLDLLQTDHTLSGIDMAMWDLLGKREGAPVHELLGIERSFAKRPYASQLFGDTPQQTLESAKQTIADGYTAAKFGWGPFGLGSVEDDLAQIEAAREGLGPDATLLIDVGTVWIDDVDKARSRLHALNRANVTWLEEPFVSGAFDAYSSLAGIAGNIALAAGEGCHNRWQAQHLIDHASIGFIQVDAGRIGGITPAVDVARYALQRGVTYVNHTFTSHLALSASLLPFASHEDDVICEYPVAPKSLAWDVTEEHIERDADGMVTLPDGPGLGMTIDTEKLRTYLVDVDITVAGKSIYRTPSL
jgi:L-alanine-DL-glutamate epimerase-like enolase superfamily enzyme